MAANKMRLLSARSLRAGTAAPSGLAGLRLAGATLTAASAKTVRVRIGRAGPTTALVGNGGFVSAGASSPVSISPGASLGGTSGECRHGAQDDNFLFHSFLPVLCVLSLDPRKASIAFDPKRLCRPDQWGKNLL